MKIEVYERYDPTELSTVKRRFLWKLLSSDTILFAFSGLVKTIKRIHIRIKATLCLMKDKIWVKQFCLSHRMSLNTNLPAPQFAKRSFQGSFMPS